MSSPPPPPAGLVNRWQNSIHQEKQCRALALDYALGTCLIGLIPVNGYYALRLLGVLLLIAKMLRDMGRCWGFVRGQDMLAIAGNLLGAVGAMATAFLVWLGFLGAGIWIPYVDSFKGAAGLFTLTWMLGQSTNQYYAHGDRRRILSNLGYDTPQPTELS